MIEILLRSLLMLLVSIEFFCAITVVSNAIKKYINLSEDRSLVKILNDCSGLYSNNLRMKTRIEVIEDIITNDNISRIPRISNGTRGRACNMIRYMKLCIDHNEKEEKIKKRFEEINSRLNES